MPDEIKKQDQREYARERLSDPMETTLKEEDRDPRIDEAWAEFFQNGNEAPLRDLGLIP